ncbi:MAG: type II toxin-antitoxin system RelE/ParE family toxin [Gammaproteobacteria bacterium]|nr:type II toxin-antitoxin system RelE/ParE family toxin [Gammaproteobacteria bacterium]MYF67303.1 type II toxin-antitoxin system RelE/ParE family toxin [Gammaproteobacteria bacterium]MYK36736.1 type II toxin-antitoxin system RelE/ParE family toxin [Gammaproteobacteria bacterium]
MTAARVQGSAALRIDEIYRYSNEHWGEAQADAYITGLFNAFDKIAGGGVMSRPIPAEFGVDGYFFRYKKHFVYWKWLTNGDVGIVTVLHERMHQFGRFQEDFPK